MRSAALTQPQIRDRILAEAERLFRAQGYRRTTVADIAAACEMSPANVYRFFDGKAEICEAITEVVLNRQYELGRGIVGESRSATVRLQRLLLETHTFCCDQYLDQAQVHELVTRAMDEQWSVIQAHVERMRGLYQRLVEDGIKRGEFVVDDAEQAARSVFNAVLPFCHPQLIAEQFADDHGRQAAAMARFLCRALGAIASKE